MHRDVPAIANAIPDGFPADCKRHTHTMRTRVRIGTHITHTHMCQAWAVIRACETRPARSHNVHRELHYVYARVVRTLSFYLSLDNRFLSLLLSRSRSPLRALFLSSRRVSFSPRFLAPSFLRHIAFPVLLFPFAVSRPIYLVLSAVTFYTWYHGCTCTPGHLSVLQKDIRIFQRLVYMSRN